MAMVAREGRLGGTALPEADAGAEVERVLAEAVTSHLESDVPLGAFLSGGIDSTTVVALMQRASNRPVRTFTVQFDDPVHDEAPHAEAVAAHLGTEHTTIPLRGDDALALVPRLVDIYDEPFADASQLPSLLVSAAARRHVTVVLTGDGGDELFAGYNRYLYGERVLRRLDAIPRFARRAAARLVSAAPAGSIDRAAGRLACLPGVGGVRLAEEKARKLGRLMAMDTTAGRYHRLLGTGRPPVGAETEVLPLAVREAFSPGRAGAALLDRMLLADQLSYLPDNQMTKVDRASMAVSLEARVPLLDHRVAELAWRLPRAWLVRGGVTKWALRHIAYAHVPRALLDRPKVGFSVPLAGWLRGALRPWAEPLLSEGEVRHGPLDPGEVAACWRRLLAGFDDVAPAAWAMVTFEAWRRRWLG
jgi:asparagine synthase (glutamine-hydrolysing)